MRNATAWKPPISRSNARRSFAYATDDVDRTLSRADRAAGHDEASAVQRARGAAEPAGRLADQRVVRHLDLVDDDLTDLGRAVAERLQRPHRVRPGAGRGRG